MASSPAGEFWPAIHPTANSGNWPLTITLTCSANHPIWSAVIGASTHPTMKPMPNAKASNGSSYPNGDAKLKNVASTKRSPGSNVDDDSTQASKVALARSNASMIWAVVLITAQMASKGASVGA